MSTFNYYEYAGSPQGNPCLSEPFFIYAKVKLGGKHILNTQPTQLTAADVLRIAPLKDHWIITDCWYRVRTTLSGTCTVDIGTDTSATAIADDLDVTAAGDWTQGTIGKDTNGTTGAHVILGADGYLQVLVNNTPLYDYEFEVLIQVVAGDRESVDGV